MDQADSRSALPPQLAEDLDIIAEMTADFARSRDIEETLRLGLERIASSVGAEAASLFLMDSDSGDLVCRACWGPADVTGLHLPPGQGIVWRAVTENAPQLVRDTRRDPDFTNRVDQETGFVTRSILCAPLSVRDERLGAIELFNKRDGGSFAAGDRRLVQALAASAALALINARLAAAMAEQEALKRELALAADIQRAMLPGEPPAGFPIHGINLPARGVSGDFFDVVPLADGRIAFALGDVSGKGINAALLMAKTASLFRCLAKRIDGPGRLLAAIDAELAETGASGMFVTMVAGVLDPAAGTVVLASAGHEPPVLMEGGVARLVDGGLPPLGVVPEMFAAGCPESTIRLDGATLYLFTDGLTEAKGADGAMLGSDGVQALLARFAALPARQRLEALVAALPGGTATLRDDVTVMVVEDRRGGGMTLNRRFPARPERLGEIRRAVAAAAGRMGCADGIVDDLVLAVDEACQNIIRHAYRGDDGDIVVQLGCEAGHLVVRLIDFAPPVDVAAICPRSLDDVRPGGLGTHFIRTVMDEVAFLPAPAGAGNLLRMVKRIGSES
jgi:sigma-B regulation protein RsbU (phosphoserine phosphatase)